MNETFRHLARRISDACGSWQAFVLNFVLILIWAGLGPVFHYSATWQLVVNTITTVVTYLLVFLVMNTQSRDTIQMTIKLDELIASSTASNRAIALDALSETELHQLHEEYLALHADAAPCATGATGAPGATSA